MVATGLSLKVKSKVDEAPYSLVEGGNSMSRLLGAEYQDYCDLCGPETKGFLWGKGNTYEILRCPQCGLIWVNPLKYVIVEGKEKSSYWAEDVYVSTAEMQRKRFRGFLQTFVTKIGLAEPSRFKILEVGPGFGYFLDICDEFGIFAEGCDISPIAVEYANRKRNRVRLGALDRYYSDESYDAIFAFNLIEHLPHPSLFLKEARRVLKPGGFLCLETPIQESLFHKIATAGFQVSGGRINFLGIGPGGHIYKFGLRSLNFEKYGFQIKWYIKVSSPFRELWQKSSIVRFDYKFIYRSALPIVWALSQAFNQGNRVFLIQQKVA